MELDRSNIKAADPVRVSSGPSKSTLLGNQTMLDLSGAGSVPWMQQVGNQCIQRMDEYKNEQVDFFETKIENRQVLDDDALVEPLANDWICRILAFLFAIKKWLEGIETSQPDGLILSESDSGVLQDFRQAIEGFLQENIAGADEIDDIVTAGNSVYDTRENLFDLARYFVQYSRVSITANRRLCYSMVHRMILSLVMFAPPDVNPDMNFIEAAVMPDDDMADKEKSLDMGEVQWAVSIITRAEQYGSGLERNEIPFVPELETAMQVTKVQARCHVIPYHYLKAGMFTPLVDAIAGLLRYAAKREPEIPEYCLVFDLHSALMGVLYAAFPLGDAWENENSDLMGLSRDLFCCAEMGVYELLDRYDELYHKAMTNSVLEFSYEEIEPLLVMAQDILKMVNSSPQNLRVGNASTNSSILAALDLPKEDVSLQVLEGRPYADDLSDLESIAGYFGETPVHLVEPGSPTNLALIALLTLMDVGENEISAYSGTLVRDIQPALPMMESSEIPRASKTGMEEDGLPLVVPMSESIVDEYPIANFLEMDRLPESFCFGMSKEAGKGLKKQNRQPAKGEPIRSRARSKLSEAELLQRYLSMLTDVGIGEQLECIGYRAQPTSSAGNNCFFYSVFQEMQEQLINQGMADPDNLPPIEVLIASVREAIGNGRGMIDMDNVNPLPQPHGEETEEDDLPPPITAGRQVLNQIVAFWGGGFQINLEVTEPQYIDYGTGQVMFFQHMIQSDDVPGGGVINLRVFFNGFNHFARIENVR